MALPPTRASRITSRDIDFPAVNCQLTVCRDSTSEDQVPTWVQTRRDTFTFVM